MQDIDFDEIDRAVSSVSSTPAPLPAPSSPVVDTSAAVPVSVTVTPPVPAAPAETSSPAARRSTGRFMDVVHSSSDMRPPRTDAPTPVAERPIAAPAAAPTPAFQWPDPIELHEASNPPVPEAPKDIDAVIVPAVEAVTPLESPFLTDAKVEKRPLGAFSETQSESPIETQAETIEEAEELNADLLSLADHGEDTTPPPAPIVEEAAPTGPVSITQQYKEQPSSTPEASGSIFDTESYHQPVASPVKKRSTLFVVLWIVGLVVVGGGIGAAVYFFALPALT